MKVTDKARTLTVVTAVTALAAGVLVAAGQGAASASVSPTIAPATQGATAVRDPDKLDVAGSASDGTVTGARLLGTEADGDVVAEAVNAAAFNRADDLSSDFLRVDLGRLRGRLTLGCLFGEPNGFCDPSTEGIRTVRLEVTVTTANGPETGVSGPVRVDYRRPEFRTPALLGPQDLEVRFSEPVRHPQAESASDFRVVRDNGDGTTTEVPLTSIASRSDDCVYGPADDPTAGRSGCTRRLSTRDRVGEDDVLRVRYTNGAQPDGSPSPGTPSPGRLVYIDGRGNRVVTGGVGALELRDLIRPSRPSLATVDGRRPSGGAVTGGASTVQVTVGDVLPGHAVRLRVTGPDGAVRDLGPLEVPAGASSVTFTVEQLAEGTHELAATATDRAGNVSDNGTLQAARPDQINTARYVLDTIAPALRSAVIDPEGHVVVTWSEAVTAATESKDDWSVTQGLTSYPVTAVSGSGATRTLTFSGGAPPAGATLVHRPASAGRTYRDQAGNEADRGPVALNGVPLPAVTFPVTRTVVAGTTATIAGTAAPGSLVRVVRDGQPVATGTVAQQQLADGETAFAVPVPLPQDTASDFDVVATRSGAQSRPADVGTLVQDSTNPVVEVTGPSGTTHASPGTVPLTFRVREANSRGAVGVALSLDGGATYRELEVRPAHDGRDQTVTVPVPVPAGLNSSQTRLRVTAADLADRTGSAVSPTFTLDAVPPVFTARTGPTARTVTATFTEVVNGAGRTRPTDWGVEGNRVLSASSEDRQVGGRTVTVTTLTLLSDLPPNSRPGVSYAPSLPGPLAQPLVDAAGHQVASPVVQAADGIVPVAPAVREPNGSRLTRESAVRVAGTAEPGSVVEVRRGTVVVGRSATVPADGAWSATVALLADADNDLSAVATDTGGNSSSAAAVPRITQDASGPSVTIDAPTTGTELTPGTTSTISWRTADRHPTTLPVTVLVSTDGGVTYAVIARDQAPSSSYAWTVPDVKTGRAVVRVDAVDSLGNTTRRTTGFLGIGQPADGGAPPPVVVEVAAVTVTVNDRTITAGNAPLLNGTAVDADGRPVAGEPIRVFQKIWGQSAYSVLQTDPVRTDSAGRYALRVRPDRQRSYVVQVGAAKSRPLVIAVFNRVNVARPVGGTAISGGATTVTGDLDPDFASVRVGVAVLRNGRFSYLTQGLTDSTGAYSIPVRGLPRGDYALVVYTSARQGTGAGAASRAVRVS